MKYEICPCCGKPKRPKTRFKSARECIVETGAGALNIDGARIGTDENESNFRGNRGLGRSGGGFQADYVGGEPPDRGEYEQHQGRWPANFYLGDEEAARRLGEQSGEAGSVVRHVQHSDHLASTDHTVGWNGPKDAPSSHGDTGTAARFFFNVNRQIDEADPVMYCAKTSRKERDAGLEGMARLRNDLTDEERRYVIGELRQHGLL